MACLNLFLDSSYINTYNILTNANLIAPLTEQIFSALQNCTEGLTSLFPGYSIFYAPSVIFSTIITGATTVAQIEDWLNTIFGIGTFNICRNAIINGFKTQMAAALLGLKKRSEAVAVVPLIS
jgi:hypothetical protein